jgi:HK97 family phage major capsid protein
MKSSFEIRSKIAELKTEYRAKFDGITEENKAETETAADMIMAEIESLETRAANFEKIEASDAQAQTRSKSKRPIEATVISAGEDTDSEVEAYRSYLRGEARAMTAGANPNVIPTSVSTDIVSRLASRSAIVSVATPLNTSDGALINYPYSDDTAQKAVIIGEGGSMSNAVDIPMTTKPLGAYTFSTKTIAVSNTLRQDAGFDIDGFVSGKIVTRLGDGLNDSLTNGTGPTNGQPEGLAYIATVGVTTAANTAVTSDELIDLQHSVDPAYRSKGAFMMNDKTLAAFRKLKGSDGQYIVAAGINSGVPTSLLGQPVVINNDMPDIAANAKAVLYGDFSKYVIRYVAGLNFKVFEDAKYAELDQTGFLGLGRFDGLLTDGAAVRALKLKA